MYRRPCTVARVPSSGSPEGPHARVRGPKRIGLRGGYTRRVTRNHLVCAFGFGAPRRPGAVRVMVACGGCGRHASGVGHLSDVGHKHVSHWHGLCKHCHWTRLETRVDAGPGGARGRGRPAIEVISLSSTLSKRFTAHARRGIRNPVKKRVRRTPNAPGFSRARRFCALVHRARCALPLAGTDSVLCSTKRIYVLISILTLNSLQFGYLSNSLLS